MNTPTIDTLRTSITDARRELTLNEGQAKARTDELAQLESQCKELGIAPDQLQSEANRIRGDVEAAVAEVWTKLEAVKQETPKDD